MTSRWIHAAAALLLCAGSLLAGCWDYRELENRALIVGMGVEELPPRNDKGHESRRYRVVLQVVEPTAGTGQGAGMGETGSPQADRGYSNIVIETLLLTQGVALTPTRSDHSPNLAHLQVIVLDEKVAQKGLDELYDFLSRFPQMRRHTKLLVVNGPVTQYFDVRSTEEPSPAMYIAEMMENVEVSGMMPESSFGTVSINTRAKNPFFLLKARMESGRSVVIDEAAVFDNYKMVGTIKREQVIQLFMLRGEIKRQFLDFPCAGGKKSGLQILRGESKVKPSVRNGKPHITFQVELETELMEYQCTGRALDKPESIRNMERTYSRMLEDALRKTINELKNKYRKDLFRLSPRLKNHPELYKPMRENPRAFFRELTVDVRVDLKIRNIGNTLVTPILP